VGYSLEDSVVFGKHEAGFENGYFAFVNSSGGGGIGETGKISFYSGGFSITPTSTTTVTDGNWHHVLIVYRAGLSKTIYVDGAPAEDVEPSFPNNGNAAPFLIGGVNLFGQPLGLFTGFVDEVQIYSQALGDASANYLFEHPGAILHKDLPN
jgi:hypothetical protein